MTDYEYKTAPFPYQREIVERTRTIERHGLFMEMGTGKSKVTIDTAAWMYERRLIDAVLVLAPNTIHVGWVREQIPAHLPDRIARSAMAWHSSKSQTKRQRDDEDRLLGSRTTDPTLEKIERRMRWLAMSYDGVMTDRGHAFAKRFTTANPRFLLVVDESTRVKSPSSQRGRMALAVAKAASAVRVLTGTPVANGPFDVYHQIRLLDEQHWYRNGMSTFAAFQSRFGVFREIEITSGETKRRATNVKISRPSHDASSPSDPGCSQESIAAYESLDPSTYAAIAELKSVGVDVAADKLAAQPRARTQRVLAAYKDVERIHELIAPVTTRVTKEQAGLDLPPKLYSKVEFDLLPEQRKIYDQMRSEMLVELDDGAIVTATIAMVKLLRLQQIACGYLPNPSDPEGEPILIPNANEPRLAALLELLEDVPHKAIVWARFRVDVDRIVDALEGNCVRIDGAVTNPNARADAIARFRDPKGAQFFVANPAAIGMGITLNEAKSTIYYSNSFSLELREQSEDRNHRIGQHNPVGYYDLIARETVDERIVEALREKKRLAALVTGDQLREWLE